MKAATVNEIKKSLNGLEQERLVELCLRLAKYKKENKELLTYLVFEADHEETYVESVKNEIEEMFGEVSKGNVYFVKKNLRKILRMVNRQVKYSGIKKTELELRIYFCQMIRRTRIPVEKSQVLVNLYAQQLKKIGAALKTLPEDLQFDYHQDLSEIIPSAKK